MSEKSRGVADVLRLRGEVEKRAQPQLSDELVEALRELGYVP